MIELIGGILLLGIILIDFIKTTLSLQGGGFITNSVSTAIWKLFLKLAGNNGKSSLLPHAGYTILIIIFMVWVLGFWVGLFLLLDSTPDSVIKGATGQAASSWEKYYFAGYVLSTMGNGDFEPNGMPWLMVSTIFSFLGLAIITVSITYFIPVLSAVNSQRSLAIFINSIGDTPQQMLINSWNGQDFSRFVSTSTKLTTLIINYSQNHLVYPIIHYFHSNVPNQSVVVSIAVLNEAIAMMQQAVAEQVRPHEKDLHRLQKALQYYRSIVGHIYKLEDSSITPHPDISELKKAGIPLKNHLNKEAYSQQELSKSQSLFAKLLAHSGWSWQEVYQPKF